MNKQSFPSYFFTVFFCSLAILTCKNIFTMHTFSPNAYYYLEDQCFQALLPNIYKTMNIKENKQGSFEKLLIPQTFLAIRENNLENLKKLIRNDADINETLKIKTSKTIINLGITPLLLAYKKRKQKFVNYLLAKKANRKTKVGDTLYQIVVDRKIKKIGLRKYR